MSRGGTSRRRAGAGFSLLELMLVLLLLGIVMAAVLAAVTTSVHLVRRGTRLAMRSEQILASQRFLRSSLGQIRPFRVADPAGGAATALAGSPRRLRYVAPAPEVLGIPGLHVQQLRLAAGADGRWRLEWSMAALPAEGGQPRWRMPPEVLLDGIAEGRFDYRGDASGTESAGWAPQWRHRQQLPRLVSLQLKLLGPATWPRLVVPRRLDPDPRIRELAARESDR